MLRRFPVFIIAVLLLLGLPAFAEFYTDWLWFRELGYEQVFIRSLTARSTVTVAAGLVVFAVLAGNLAVAFRALRPWQFTVVTPEGPRPITMDPTRFRPLVMVAAGVLGLFVGLFAGGQWDTWLSYLYATPFGTADPILGYDVGFYVFTLPLLELLRTMAFATIFVAAAGSLAAYVLGGEVGLDPVRGVLASRAAVRHLSGLAAVLLLVLAFSAWLQIPQLMTSGSGAVYGASYTDVHARIPALRVLAVAAFAGSLLALWQMRTARFWPIAAAAAAYLVVSLAGVAYAAVIQRFVVAPNEQVRETPYITHNIQATRAAFALDRVQERSLSGEAHLTRADIDRNAATFDNVPLWNERPLLDTFGQLPSRWTTIATRSTASTGRSCCRRAS
jgi:uncharacterized membrane protein (UPF0182 family)